MAEYQSQERPYKRKRIFSLGFISLSLVIAVMAFFACFIIGMEIGPSLPI